MNKLDHITYRQASLVVFEKRLALISDGVAAKVF